MNYTIKGFPQQQGRKIEMPGEAEYLATPMFRRLDASLLSKAGSNFQRHLLSIAPLTHEYKYTYVDSTIQIIYPGVSSVGTRSPGAPLCDWHIDGIETISETKPTLFHMLQSECSATTAFNEDSIEVDLPEGMSLEEFNQYLVQDNVTLKPRQMPSGCFVTFADHPHRSVGPKQYEFRFMFRVTESDILMPLSPDQARINQSIIHVLENGKIISKPSITQHQDGFTIHVPPIHMGN